MNTVRRASGIAPTRVALRRLLGLGSIALLLGIDVYATGIFGGGERALAIARSIVLPGLPFLEWHAPLGAVVIIAALAAVGAWLRWGMDWLPLLVVSVSVVLAAFVMPLHHDVEPAPAQHIVTASHEFTVVLVVFALVAQLRLLVARLPGSEWIRRRLPEALFFPAVDVARAAAVVLLTEPQSEQASAALRDARLLRRAARVDAWARFRFASDAHRYGHAPLRAALSLGDALAPVQEDAFREEARMRLTGVPDSEPTWVRVLDGTLAALALARLGETACVERWRSTFESRFALRHGRRPAALHAPSMLSLGTANAWEHAAATALAYRAGWIDAQDWMHLRPRCLGAAASQNRGADTFRLIAAGKLWAALTKDEEARAILDRRTLDDEPVARAIDDLAAAARRPECAAGDLPSGADGSRPRHVLFVDHVQRAPNGKADSTANGP